MSSKSQVYEGDPLAAGSPKEAPLPEEGEHKQAPEEENLPVTKTASKASDGSTAASENVSPVS